MNLVDSILKKLFVVGDNVFSSRKYELSYITEGRDWAIKEIGKEVTSYLNKLDLIKARITTAPFGLRNQIIHFGSVNTFLRKKGFCKPHKSNKIVLTWFHFVSEDKRNKNIIEAQKYLSFIHTSCSKTKEDLINLGVDEQKIVVIPLGVDVNLFNPALLREKRELKRELDIPQGKTVIGSFQKDGVGWGRGLRPKLIKGPDIFIQVVEKLSKEYPIFVLLVGPARGYVEKELEKRNIPFKSVGYLSKFEKLARYYKVLDLYLITSRIEGGPKQILEAWASGVPVVSTKVGMVPDIARDGEDILLAEIKDVEQIIEKAALIIDNKQLREKLAGSGLEAVQNYSWEKITKRYYQKIYSKLVR